MLLNSWKNSRTNRSKREQLTVLYITLPTLSLIKLLKGLTKDSKKISIIMGKLTKDLCFIQILQNLKANSETLNGKSSQHSKKK